MGKSANPFEYTSTTNQTSGQTAAPKALHFAIVCGVVPIVVGLVIYVLWRVTDWPWLVTAGVFTFFGGMLFFLLGFFAWFQGRSQVYRLDVAERGRLPTWTSLTLILLLANWPVALGVIGTAMGDGRSAAITVENKTSQALTDVSFRWVSTKGHLGTIPAGAIVTRKCRVSFFHGSVVYVDYKQGPVETTITARAGTREDRFAPATVTIRDHDPLKTPDPNVVCQWTQRFDLDGSGSDQLVISYGQGGPAGVTIERVINGRMKWYENADQLGKGYDEYFHDAQISIDGDEFQLDCEGTDGKFHECRDLETGKLLERTEDSIETTPSPASESD